MKLTSINSLENQPVSHNPAITKKVMLSPGDIPHLIYFSQAHFPPGEVASKHSHADMHEIFFVESGSGIIKINDRDYSLLPGTCLAVAPGEFHEIINTGAIDLVITYFAIKD